MSPAPRRPAPRQPARPTPPERTEVELIYKVDLSVIVDIKAEKVPRVVVDDAVVQLELDEDHLPDGKVILYTDADQHGHVDRVEDPKVRAKAEKIADTFPWPAWEVGWPRHTTS